MREKASPSADRNVMVTVMMEIEAFLAYAEERLATDEPLPCEPEDYAAMLVYLMALVPEYQLERQTEIAAREAKQADRRRAALDGFRRARGVPAAKNGNGNGNEKNADNPSDRAGGRASAAGFGLAPSVPQASTAPPAPALGCNRVNRAAAPRLRNKLPPSYSMTSSAMASRLDGMVRPSAFAVLRLMTISNFVGS
jgi:hypothetical protein